MKLLDKIKDLLSDEEEIIEEQEIEVEKEEENENKLPTFMRNKIEEEQRKAEVNKGIENNIVSEREIVKTRSNTFNFPVDLDEDLNASNNISSNSNSYANYNNYNHTNKNVLDREKTVSELYTKKEEPKPKKFKPTPVISPVYGVLDKNYTKDEVKVQDEKNYEIKRTAKKVDFETVRNKAYGSLTDDIRNNLCENCELYKEVKITKNIDKKEIVDDGLLSDMTKEDDITLETAEDNYFDFGVDYEVPKREDKASIVINTEELEINNDIKIVNHNEEEATAEKIEVKERSKKTKLNDTLEDTKEFAKVPDDDIPVISKEEKEENDIFNLIDSMYEGDEK